MPGMPVLMWPKKSVDNLNQLWRWRYPEFIIESAVNPNFVLDLSVSTIIEK